jgi:hypothetical protein
MKAIVIGIMPQNKIRERNHVRPIAKATEFRIVA